MWVHYSRPLQWSPVNPLVLVSGLLDLHCYIAAQVALLVRVVVLLRSGLIRPGFTYDYLLIIQILFSVYSREPCPVHQVLCRVGVSVSVPDSSAPHKHHYLHASVASGDPQVWQEDQFLCGHVDVTSTNLVHAVCRLCPHDILRAEFLCWNGHLLCLPVAMVRK